MRCPLSAHRPPPVQAPVAASNVAAGASAAPVQASRCQRSSRRIGRRPRPGPCRCFQRSSRRIGRRPRRRLGPDEPVQYDAPENPYDTTIVDYESEVESSDVDSDDESFHTKTRHVLRRLQSGQYGRPFAQGIYKCPFCNRRLFDTNFNTLLNHAESIGRYGARVGSTVNVHAYMAKHKALGIHLRNLQASHTRHLEALNVPTALSIMTSHSINFNQFLEKEKLKSNCSNFTDRFRHLRIFLTRGNLQYVLDAPLGAPHAPAVCEEVKNVYKTRKTQYSQVQCAILCSLEAELQKRFEHHDPCELVRELKDIFETHAAVESYEASKHFFGCMMEEGSSVSEHVLAMSGHAKKLDDLGIVIPNQLGIHRVLQSLSPSYKNFVMNYNMQTMNKELPELFSMLQSAEVEIRKEQEVLMVTRPRFQEAGQA
ncbi:hypothetical protein QYE76_067631 [Lolium multiflorum]|uniref:Uncharacterized protein n=1 Tax=Lolium multiflorum TaxID=4521 RepID=A0AAD8SE84_LOLMU|nr:hypothetical protein QYE76_067631 [Lolium multiflorum]